MTTGGKKENRHGGACRPGASGRRSSDFVVVSWRDNLLSAVVDMAIETTGASGGDLSKACFIFPHKRPARYIADVLRGHPKVKKPLLMPEMWSVGQLFELLARAISGRPSLNAGLLDRIGLLHEVVRKVVEEDGRGGAFAKIAKDAQKFFPWGVRLAGLFEESLNHGRAPSDLPDIQGMAPEFAVILLERLGRIFDLYVAGLRERSWSTPGLDAFIVARAVRERGLPLNNPLAGKQIFLAGFHALTGAEDAVFRRLWEEHSACVILHADPAIVRGKAHWSCGLLADWAKNWKAGLCLAMPATALERPAGGKGDDSAGRERPWANVRYYEGYDLHSQLRVIRDELLAGSGLGPTSLNCPAADRAGGKGGGVFDGKNGDAQGEAECHNSNGSCPASCRYDADTALVLPDAGLLVPVLHHLPDVNVNISMGYPLARSSLFRLLDSIFSLHENAGPAGYYWRDFINLLRHPYARKLKTCPASGDDGDNVALARGEAPAEQAGAESAALVFHELERQVRNSGHKFLPRSFVEEMFEKFSAGGLDAASDPPQSAAGGPGEGKAQRDARSAAALAMASDFLGCCLDGFSAPQTPAALAAALERLCVLLMENGAELWGSFPIDSECMYRLQLSIIPELAHSSLSGENFEPRVIYALARSLVEQERVPFEAEPLVGTQIMGMLETRLLTFRRLIVPDVNDDVLPGSASIDPLLPEILRPVIGLPDAVSRGQTMAYTFFRLVAGAGECSLFWQEGATPKGLDDRRKKKSRFVEELLWEEEKHRRELFMEKTSAGPLEILTMQVHPLATAAKVLPFSPRGRDLVGQFLKRPIYASALDDYLQCPARFFQGRILALGDVEEPVEGYDAGKTGELIHAVLNEFYEARLGRLLPAPMELPKADYDSLISELHEIFLCRLEAEPFAHNMPADSLAMVKAAGQARLEAFIRHQPATTVLNVEQSLSGAIDLGGARYVLSGRIDRIDLRENGPVILDYKTGNFSMPASTIWEETRFWEMIASWNPQTHSEKTGENFTNVPDRVFTSVRERFSTMQLPFYMLLYEAAKKESAADAALVDLKKTGLEHSLFSPDIDDLTAARARISHMPTLLKFLLHSMANETVFHPIAGQHCEWCPFAASCRTVVRRRIISAP